LQRRSGGLEGKTNFFLLIGFESRGFCTDFAILGPDSSVGIATGYWLDGPGIESRWGRDLPPLGPTQPLVQWVPGFPGGKERPGRDADPSPLLVPWSRKSTAIPLLPLWAVRPVHSLSSRTRVHFTFTFTLSWLRLLTVRLVKGIVSIPTLHSHICRRLFH